MVTAAAVGLDSDHLREGLVSAIEYIDFLFTSHVLQLMSFPALSRRRICSLSCRIFFSGTGLSRDSVEFLENTLKVKYVQVKMHYITQIWN